MQPMEHNPGAVGIGAQVVANGARGLAAGTTASAAVTALVPAGADEVSAQAALAFAGEGVEMLAHEYICAGRAGPRGCGIHGDRRHLRRGRRRQRQPPSDGHLSSHTKDEEAISDVLAWNAAGAEHCAADGGCRTGTDAAGCRGVGGAGDFPGDSGR